MPMPLNAADKLLVREIFRDVVATPGMQALLADVAERAAERVIREQLEHHVDRCPVRIKLDRTKWFLLGAVLAGSAFGGAIAPAVWRALTGM